MNVAQETLGFRRAGLSPALSLLMSAFALPIPPARFTPHLRRPTERSPTIHTLHETHSSSCPGNRLRSAGRLDFDDGIAAGALRAAASSSMGASALDGVCESAISVPSLS